MRVAALYDIHGNMPALEAVLAEVEHERVDVLVIGGDFAAGPRGSDVVDRLRELGERARFLSGNAERELLEPRYSADDADAGERLDFVRRQLNAERLDFLRTLPAQVVLDVEGLGRVLFCHGSPRTDMEILTRATPDSRLRAALAAVDADVVVCGHTHMQFVRTLDGYTLTNAGSVGMPYEGRPGAYWAVLGPGLEHRRTDYDVEAAVAAARTNGYPGSADYAETLLRPPPPDEVVEYFEQLARDKPELAGAA